MMSFLLCFNTQPPEGGWNLQATNKQRKAMVSTHSRLKAAGHVGRACAAVDIGFNTQPPEGGWGRAVQRIALFVRFNTQPPEGGWGPS